MRVQNSLCNLNQSPVTQAAFYVVKMRSNMEGLTSDPWQVLHQGRVLISLGVVGVTLKIRRGRAKYSSQFSRADLEFVLGFDSIYLGSLEFNAYPRP